MDTQVLTQDDLGALEARRAELDEQIAAVKRSLHGPIPSGSSWSYDDQGPVLYFDLGGELGWCEDFFCTDREIPEDYKITLECLEMFCQRTRAWREAQTATTTTTAPDKSWT